MLNRPLPPKSIAELFYKTQKYTNAEGAVVAKELTDKRKRDEGTSCHLEKKKETQSLKQTLNGKRNLPSRRSNLANLTPLIMPIE